MQKTNAKNMPFRMCAVNTCYVRATGATTKTFYQIFAKNRSFEAWKEFCANDNVTTYSYVCDRHFTDQDFVNKNNHSQGLVPYAVPSIRDPPENGPASTPDGSQSEILVPKQELFDAEFIAGEIKVPQSVPIIPDPSTQELFFNCKTTIVKNQEMDSEDLHNTDTFIITELPSEHAVSPVETATKRYFPLVRRSKPNPDAEVVHHHHDYLGSPELTSNVRVLTHELAKVREENILLKKKLRNLSKNMSQKNILIRNLRTELKRLKNCTYDNEEFGDDDDDSD